MINTEKVNSLPLFTGELVNKINRGSLNIPFLSIVIFLIRVKVENY
ncbi:hypothetical protein SAAV_c07 (plasmid) [Staphylococcus aureus subsp. aureus ED98]|nr:hypothetical protein SAAV_c07 [Staphylococcus aureus subsp. aureus ED98]